MPDSPSDKQPLGRRSVIFAGLAASATIASFYGLSRLVADRPVPEGLAQILRDPDAPVLGNPEGDVTVVEYFDYQCSFCRAGHDALMAGVAEDGRTRLLLRDWPIFGATSIYASQMVLGASELGHYHAASAALMALAGRLDERRIDAALGDAGIDPAQAMAGYHDNRRTWDSFMIRNGRQAMQMGFQGTPSFVIGTRTHSGVLGGAALARAIRRARDDGPVPLGIAEAPA